MTKNYKKLSPTKRILYIVSLVTLVGLVSWDVMVADISNVVEGTFRQETDFPWDGITAPTYKHPVSIITSDYDSLSAKASRSADINYDQIEAMVYQAIKEQGSLPYIIEAGDTVMMKINLVEEDSYNGLGENTDNRVVKALMLYIHEMLEGDVTLIVAEGTARKNDNPEEDGSVWDECGYTDFLTDPDLADVDFSFLNLNQSIHDIEEVDLNVGIKNKGTAAPHNYKYKVHEKELSADVYISVPVLKIHNTGITAGLKNQIGTAPGCYYGYNKCKGTEHYGGLVHDVAQRRWTTEEIVDLCKIADIDYVLVDAVMTLETYKNYKGNNQFRMNTILAGADPVAVDNVCSRMMGVNPDDVAHITLAEKMDLGTNNTDWIEVLGVPLAEAKMSPKQSTDESGLFGQSCRTWTVSQSFSGVDIDEAYIAGEDTLCPTPGENGWSEATYFFDDRIDLLSFFSGASNITSYAFTYFTAPEEKEVDFWIGTEEDMKIYLNGEEIYRFSGSNNFPEGNGDGSRVTKILSTTVKKGVNKLMVKTNHTANDYSFCLNICEPESVTYLMGNRVEGLKFTMIDTTSQQGNPDSFTNKKANVASVSMYPNPVVNEATLTFGTEISGIANVTVYDMQGKAVYMAAEDINNNGISLNLSELTGNNYYICAIEIDGAISSVKFLKK